MNAIEMVAILILILVVLAVIAEPLFRRFQEVDEPLADLPEEAEDLYRRKESAYSAIKELEFDFKTDKLSQADFKELDARYRNEALEIMRAIDLYESEMFGAAAEGSSRREGVQDSGTSVRPSPLQSTAAPRGRTAESLELAEPETCICGFENIEGARYCTACGEFLHEQTETLELDGDERSVCPECGAEVEAEHRFCAHCGAQTLA